MKKKILLYDTTLRDGSQSESISFSLEDKLLITKKLDNFGVDYIEGGWPGSNIKDIKYFREVSKLKLKRAKITAFGSTRHAKHRPEDDPNLKELINAKTPAITIFGKTWDFHVKQALRVSFEKNLEMIYDSVKYLKSHGREVIYDAEHFFDGYKSNPEYAIKTLKEAEKGKADFISLCDTNGGRLPSEISEIFKEIKKHINTPLGIHAHNDSELAVANSLMAVENGAVMVQGTMNGYGERCGNANLCSIIPNLQFKLGIQLLKPAKMKQLVSVSQYVSEMANLEHDKRLPFVGKSVFTHKGGIHVSAVQRNALTYEHINPEKVGNKRRIVVSELSGKSNILYKLKEFGMKIEKNIPIRIVGEVKKLEDEGYQFEEAEGSLELLIKKATGKYKTLFNLVSYRIIIEKREDKTMISEATVKLKIRDQEEYTVAVGNGPVNALDLALRKALVKFYPKISRMELIDYKVRVLGSAEGTAAKVRVLIESKAMGQKWVTVGVSENVIEASWDALIDAVHYLLLKVCKKKK